MFKQLFINITIIMFATVYISCSKDEIIIHELSSEQAEIISRIPSNAIIAHRGTCTMAPEGTEAAMRWARNAGATYLECDLQRTKDGYLVIFHDLSLTRTTDVQKKYPQRVKSPISEFTLEELFTLDLGSWFNDFYPASARLAFRQLDILTLEDLIKIAEGYKIQRDAFHKRIFYKGENGHIFTSYEPDPADNGHRPGIYIETKEPQLYPGIESDIHDELERLGWYSDNEANLKTVKTRFNAVDIGNTPERVVIQTFSQASLKKLKQTFHRLIPFCLLVWIDSSEMASKEYFNNLINFAINEGASIIGTCCHNKEEIFNNAFAAPWIVEQIKEKKLLIHAYMPNPIEQVHDFIDIADGFFVDDVNDWHLFLLKSNKVPAVELSYTGPDLLKILGY